MAAASEEDNFTIEQLNTILPNGDIYLFNVFFEHFEKIKPLLDTKEVNVDYVNDHKSLFGMCCKNKDYDKALYLLNFDLYKSFGYCCVFSDIVKNEEIRYHKDNETDIYVTCLEALLLLVILSSKKNYMYRMAVKEYSLIHKLSKIPPAVENITTHEYRSERNILISILNEVHDSNIVNILEEIFKTMINNDIPINYTNGLLQDVINNEYKNLAILLTSKNMFSVYDRDYGSVIELAIEKNMIPVIFNLAINYEEEITHSLFEFAVKIYNYKLAKICFNSLTKKNEDKKYSIQSTIDLFLDIFNPNIVADIATQEWKDLFQSYLLYLEDDVHKYIGNNGKDLFDILDEYKLEDLSNHMI